MKNFIGLFMLLTGMTIVGQSGDFNFEESLLARARTIRSVVYSTDIEKLSSNSSINEIKKQTLNLALSCYNRILDTLPNSKYKYEVLLGKGDINFDLGNEREAKEIYLELYNANDRDWNFGRLDEYYKYGVAIKLAELSIQNGNCLNASKYLDKAQTYIYGACGRQLMDDRKYLEELRKKCK